MKTEYRLIAFDLDGTLTLHHSPLCPTVRSLLDRLRDRYALLLVSAAPCARAISQTGDYPIDILGNYGMERSLLDPKTGKRLPTESLCMPVDTPHLSATLNALREKHGFTAVRGDALFVQPTGLVALPFLGMDAPIAEKRAFDPTRTRRRAFFEDVKGLFPDCSVFLCGSSSLDIVPHPHDKYRALSDYCRAHGIDERNVLYCGDEWCDGGNDEPVFRSAIRCLAVHSPNELEALLSPLLQ